MKTKRYTKEDMTVLWKPELCYHSGVCVRGLGKVFRPNEQPWIQVEHASAEEIAAQVRRCPSGALSIAGEVAQTASQATRVTAVENGPLMLEGNFELVVNGENIGSTGSKVALCRCGASSKKPLCDGTHKKSDFKASAF